MVDALAEPSPALHLSPPHLQVEPKRQELAAANAKLQEANTMLAAVQQKVRRERWQPRPPPKAADVHACRQGP